MSLLKKIFFSILCMATTFLLPAQQTVQTETKEVWLTISATYKQNDSIVGFLYGAENIGLTQGQLLKAFQSPVKAVDGVSPAKEFAETGSGYIVIHEGKPSAFIRLYNADDTLVAGDVIQITLAVPVLPYRGIFSDLAFANLIFTDADRNPIYSLEYLLNNDSRQVEDSIFSVIVEGLHDTYQRVKDRTDLPEVLFVKIKNGRFRNRAPLEIIRDATKQEINAFFLYITAYPVGYIGKNYRASESLAGWLVSNSPYSVGEIKNGLFPYYKNKEEFKKRLPEYKADAFSENTASQIAREATELSGKLKFDEAHDLADFAIALSEAINDTATKPTVYICKAQVLLDQDKFTESILWCDKSIKAAQVAKDRDIEMQAIIKKGFCYYKISKYKETELTLAAAKVKLEAYRKELGEAKYNNNLRKIFEYRSSIRYRSGRYDESLRLLDTAIALNDKINSYDANITNAGYYSFIGRVYNDQGKPDDALLAFSKAERIYKNAIDLLQLGSVENDMAYSYYKLGQYRASIDKAATAMSRLLKAGDINNAGYSKSLMGSSYWSLGMYDSSLAAHKQSVELRKKGGNLEGEAYSWNKIGELYDMSGSKKLSLQAYDTAIYLYRLIKDSSGLADLYNAKGSVFLKDENFKKATGWFEMAKGLSNKSTVEALYNLGIAWRGIDTAKARKYYSEARQKSRDDGNINYHFFASRSLAMLAYAAEDTITGDKYYNECMELSLEMKTAYSKALCLSLKAYRYETAIELDSALYYYDQSMAITDTVDKSESAYSLNSIAGVHISKGEFKKADEALNKAIALSRDISDSISLASTLQYSTFLFARTAEFDKGLARNDSAVAIFSKSGHLIRLAGTYTSRGTLLSSMGDNKRSVQAFLYADSLYKDEWQEDQRGIVFNNIGIVYTSQGDYTTALKYLQKALSLIRKGVVNESYLLTQGNIAESLVGLKKEKEAKELLLDILPKAQKRKLHRIASGMALVLGKIYLNENKLKEAAAYYGYAKEYAQESGEQEKMIDALTNLGRISARENKMEAAKASLYQSVALTRRYQIAIGWESYYELGLVFYNEQKADSAIVYFKQAVELLDKNAENLYGGEEAKKIFNNDPRKEDLYSKITFSYYNLGNIKEAWAYANRSNMAGIKELSGSLSVNSSDAEKNDALKKLLAMQQSKKALEQTLEKQEGVAKQETLKKIEILEADYNNFLQDVVEKYPELSTYFSRSNADEFNNYKGKLPEDVAVALYLVNDKTLMIFTLTNEKLAVDTMTLDIAPRVSIFIETIKNVKKQTGTGPLSERSEPQDEENAATGVEFKDISDELYQALITTVYDKIGHKKKLCIIPTGVFSNMPFQCLGKKVSTDNFRFLIEDHSIFYTNKMSVFNPEKKTGGGDELRSSFAAFGVPDATLRYNISEVKAIGKILGSDSTVYADATATESMAKQSLRSKKYIHFATHGVLNYSSDYSQSYLKLLPDKDTSGGNNGQLTMREIQKLGITDCNMVILSACQTAVTKQLVKGWNISPANSFLVSKVRSVVASLWKVADEPTGLLMEYLYENLEKKMDKVEALRQAQIRLSQDPRFRHPNYWGAFVLYGEWQ
ncbi:MAG: CHAT domain-containing protein [Chitinophagaceae bacterium]